MLETVDLRLGVTKSIYRLYLSSCFYMTCQFLFHYDSDIYILKMKAIISFHGFTIIVTNLQLYFTLTKWAHESFPEPSYVRTCGFKKSKNSTYCQPFYFLMIYILHYTLTLFHEIYRPLFFFPREKKTSYLSLPV
jgi:hypothetical protein